MLSRLTMKLKSKKELTYNQASLFQGALMEIISPEYAEQMHSGGLNPYSQYLKREKDDWYWTIQTVTQEAKEEIIDRLNTNEFTSLFLKHNEMKIEIEEKNLTTVPMRDLLQDFYFQDKPRIIEITFLTPTSFKQRGMYLIYPDLRCLYQSLMRKYGMARQEEMDSEETLEQLVNKSTVVQYNLKSCYFYLEGVKIPAFSGKIKIKIAGPQTMVNFAHLLCEFGEYSGVGVKTAIGMGAMEIRKVART